MKIEAVEKGSGVKWKEEKLDEPITERRRWREWSERKRR